MHRNCQMFQQGEKVYFIRENENKRQYPVLPVSENIKKKKSLNNFNVVDFIDLWIVSVATTKESIKSVYIFITEMPIIGRHFQR